MAQAVDSKMETIRVRPETEGAHQETDAAKTDLALHRTTDKERMPPPATDPRSNRRGSSQYNHLWKQPILPPQRTASPSTRQAGSSAYLGSRPSRPHRMTLPNMAYAPPHIAEGALIQRPVGPRMPMLQHMSRPDRPPPPAGTPLTPHNFHQEHSSLMPLPQQPTNELQPLMRQQLETGMKPPILQPTWERDQVIKQQSRIQQQHDRSLMMMRKEKDPTKQSGPPMHHPNYMGQHPDLSTPETRRVSGQRPPPPKAGEEITKRLPTLLPSHWSHMRIPWDIESHTQYCHASEPDNQHPVFGHGNAAYMAEPLEQIRKQQSNMLKLFRPGTMPILYYPTLAMGESSEEKEEVKTSNILPILKTGKLSPTAPAFNPSPNPPQLSGMISNDSQKMQKESEERPKLQQDLALPLDMAISNCPNQQEDPVQDNTKVKAATCPDKEEEKEQAAASSKDEQNIMGEREQSPLPSTSPRSSEAAAQMLQNVTGSVVDLVTRLTMSAVNLHQNTAHNHRSSIEHSLIDRMYTDPLEPPNWSGDQVLDNITKNIRGYGACPACRVKLLKMTSTITSVRPTRKRSRSEMLLDQEPDQPKDKMICLDEETKWYSQVEQGNGSQCLSNGPLHHSEDGTSLARLEKVREDVSHNLGTLAKSMIAGCLWNILDLPFNERRKRTMDKAQIDCTIPLPIKADMQRRLEDAVKSGLTFPKKKN